MEYHKFAQGADEQYPLSINVGPGVKFCRFTISTMPIPGVGPRVYETLEVPAVGGVCELAVPIDAISSGLYDFEVYPIYADGEVGHSIACDGIFIN